MKINPKNIIFCSLGLITFQANAFGVEIGYDKVLHGCHPLVEQDDPIRNGSQTIQQWVQEISLEDELSSVSRINLQDNAIGDNGATILYDLIDKHIPNLKELDLSFNPVGIKSGVLFAPLLLRSNFDHLVLVDTKAGSLDGREAIRAALENKVQNTPTHQLPLGETHETLVDRCCNKIIYIPKARLEYNKQMTPAAILKYHEAYYRKQL